MATAHPPRSQGSSLQVVDELLRTSLEPGYAAAARRRNEQEMPSAHGGRGLITAITMTVIGVLMATSALTLRAPAVEEDSPRAELAAELVDRQSALEERAAALADDQQRLDAEQEQVLKDSGDGGVLDRATAYRLAAGGTMVTGPGLTVSLDDAPPPDDPDETAERVLASDLQQVTNGLWAAGAEAIAINGHRLTATSSIRFAGEAIVVDFRALTRPYTVQAIGPGDLERAFEQTGGATHLEIVGEEYGLQSSIDTANDLRLAADTGLALRYARAAEGALTEPISRENS